MRVLGPISAYTLSRLTAAKHGHWLSINIHCTIEVICQWEILVCEAIRITYNVELCIERVAEGWHNFAVSLLDRRLIDNHSKKLLSY